MNNWYLYYRLLWSLRYGEHAAVSAVRLELQDVLIDLRFKAEEELRWPAQKVQDFFESLVVQTKREGHEPFSSIKIERYIIQQERENISRPVTL
jgi:hypothetical protein